MQKGKNMARIYPLFSSSKGNSSFLGNPSAGILIYAGASFKKLCGALDRCGIEIGAVKGVFITHSHSDHVKGLKTLTAKTGIPVAKLSASLLKRSLFLHALKYMSLTVRPPWQEWK